MRCRAVSADVFFGASYFVPVNELFVHEKLNL
jgi:hypothetical protein